MPYEEREAEDAREDLDRDLNVRELPEPPTSSQSWEKRPTKRIRANEQDVNSTPVLNTDQTIPMMLHTSSAHEEGNVPLFEVCQALSCREHTIGDNGICPPYGQHNHFHPDSGVVSSDGLPEGKHSWMQHCSHRGVGGQNRWDAVRGRE